jgi:hypothetical protein
MDLIFSFWISFFNNAPTPSTSPFPCLVAKKFQISEHPSVLLVDVVR